MKDSLNGITKKFISGKKIGCFKIDTQKDSKERKIIKN